MADGSTYYSDSGWSNVSRLWDGSLTTGEAHDPDAEGWVEYDFGANKTISQVRFNEDNDGNYQATDWKVQYWDGSAYQDMFAYTASGTSAWQEEDVNVTTSKIRLYVKNTNASGKAAAKEFEALGN